MENYTTTGIYKSTKPLWELVTQYKLLYEFWEHHQGDNEINKKDLRDRLDYLKKHPEIIQRNEVETLLWILGDIDESK